MGLLKTAATVAVASSVHGRVQRRQQARWAGQDQAHAGVAPAPPQQMHYGAPPSMEPSHAASPPPAPPVYAAPAPVPHAPGSPAQAAPTIDPLALLGKLVTLQSAGQLTQAEYEQLKTALMHYGAPPQQMHA